MLKNYTCHGVADKRSLKELKVWQKSYELCLEIYRITAKFPKEERYGLTSQIRRSVVSIPSMPALLNSLRNIDVLHICSL